jgi:hypothetical protein
MEGDMLTEQQIFNRVWTHLNKQGDVSYGVGGCRYRGPGGTSCAVGCLIPDDLYEDWMEGLAVSAPEMKPTLYEAGLIRDPFGRTLDLLCALQYAHDTILKSHGLEDWRNEMGMIARKYGIEVPAE